MFSYRSYYVLSPVNLRVYQEKFERPGCMHALLSEINFQDPKKKIFENIEKEPSVVTPPAPKYPKLH